MGCLWHTTVKVQGGLIFIAPTISGTVVHPSRAESAETSKKIYVTDKQ